MPLTPVALNVIAVPTHSGFGDALTLVIVGNGLTVTAEVTDVLLVQPVPATARNIARTTIRVEVIFFIIIFLNSLTAQPGPFVHSS